MTQITACIVALTLTGSPVTTSLCAAACGHESAPRAHCHDSLTESATTAMSGETTCATATTDIAYIKEDVAAPQAAAVSPITPATFRLTATAPVARRMAPPVVTGWLAPPVIPRI